MIIQWIINGLSVLANYTIFPICDRLKTTSANVGQELIKKYPDKAFQIFWSFGDFRGVHGTQSDFQGAKHDSRPSNRE